MNHKNNKRSEATKNKIKRALISMLEEQELNKITVMALCEKANINRSTFYNHYSSPKSILIGMQNDFIHSITSLIKETLDVFTDDKSESLKRLMSSINELIRDNLETCRVLGNPSLCPELSSLLMQDSTISEFARFLVSDSFPEDKYEYLHHFLSHGTMHTLSLWMEKGCEESPQEMAELITSFTTRF